MNDKCVFNKNAVFGYFYVPNIFAETLLKKSEHFAMLQLDILVIKNVFVSSFIDNFLFIPFQ